MKSFKQFIIEGKNDYKIFHKSFTSAVDEVLAFIKKNGYDVNGDDVFSQISTGIGRPKKGKTNKFTLPLYKNEKLSRKAAHFQVYGMDSGNYELNLYIS